MPEVIFSVPGRPVPWGCNEWEWRKRVFGKALDKRKEREDIPPAVAQGIHFSVTLVFRLKSGSIERADLDNLAKPVLDTLFKSRNAQGQGKELTGAMFDVDDDRVFHLMVEKKPVIGPEDEGVDITISW